MVRVLSISTFGDKKRCASHTVGIKEYFNPYLYVQTGLVGNNKQLDHCSGFSKYTVHLAVCCM